MANVTIYDLEQENNIKDTDFAPISDGVSTRKVSLSGNFAKNDLSNVSEIEENAGSLLVDTVLSYLKFDTEDSGLLLNKDVFPFELKTSIYSVNDLLPNDPNNSRNLVVQSKDIPVSFLGNELLKSDGSSFATIDELIQINNISQFNRFPEIYDYVKVISDDSKYGEALGATTYYMLIGFNERTGAIEPLTLPNANNNSSWVYFGYEGDFSTISIQYILESIKSFAARIDLLDVPVDERREYNQVSREYDSEITYNNIYDWINSRISKDEAHRLDNLDDAGQLISNDSRLNEINKGDYKESDPTITNESYQYNAGYDFGNSRFARKSLNNLKKNGEEQLYDPLTDWGDNRFAHKALDNLKTSTNEAIEEYDANLDFGNSRFARKNLNNLRSETYTILNDRVPRTMSYSLNGESIEEPFMTSKDYSFSNDENNVSFNYVKITTPVPLDSGTTNLTENFSYTATNETMMLPTSFPTLDDSSQDVEQAPSAGIINAEQARRIKDSVIAINGIGSVEWKDQPFYDSDGNPVDISQLVPDSDLLLNGNSLISGKEIPVEYSDWDASTWTVREGRSVGDRILRLEQLGVFVGSFDNAYTSYHKVTNVSQISVSSKGTGYNVGDVVSVETDIDGKYMYLQINGYSSTSVTLSILTGDGCYNSTSTITKEVFGGSGTGMTVKITPSATASTILPLNTKDNPLYAAWTINDYANVRSDETHNGLATRYVITAINSDGDITWGFDIYLDTPDRNFAVQPITHNELADNAVENNNILDGTIEREKLAFTLLSFVEITSGTADFNNLPSNSLFVIDSDNTLHSPLSNTSLNIPSEILNTVDNNKWYVNQFFIRNNNTSVDPAGTIIGGIQQAISFTNPALTFTRTMIPPADLNGTTPGTWADDTSTSINNWKLPYASYM